MSSITKHCSDQFNNFMIFCKKNCASLQEGINEGIRNLKQNPILAAKVAVFAIGIFAVIAVFFKLGLAIGSFAAATFLVMVPVGFYSVCFFIFNQERFD